MADDLKALRALVLYHETGGHEGDGSDANLCRAKAELAALRTPSEPAAIDEREIELAATAVAREIHGPDFDPFNSPETWDHCVRIAFSALSTKAVEVEDHG